MKAKSFLLVVLVCVVYACNQQQKEQTNQTGKKFLHEFYTNYLKLHERPYNAESYAREEYMIDSMLMIHCTGDVYELTKKFRDNGRDYVTMDLGSAEKNSNLHILEESSSTNEYIVSFDALFSDVPGGPMKVHVTLKVSLIKVGRHFKIAGVELKSQRNLSLPDFEEFWSTFRTACLSNEQNQLLPLIADSFLVEGFEDGDKVHLVTNSDSIWAIVQSFLNQKGTVAYGGSWSIDPILEAEVYSNPIENHLIFIKEVSDLKQYPNLIEDQNWKRIENMNFHCLDGEWKFTGVYISLKE